MVQHHDDESMSRTASSETATSNTTSVSYRCVCGRSFELDPSVGGQCPSCHRDIPAAAFAEELSATMSLSSIEEKTQWEFSTDHGHDDPHIGLKLDHFLLEKRIGEGGMGVVYRALDTSLQRYVAVKVLRRGIATNNSNQHIEQLLQEAIAQARLNHPNIVTIYYVGSHNDEPFLAMELTSGKTVAQQAKEQPLPFQTIIHLAVQIVDALRHASHFGIVHGDIKPSNLLIAGPSRIKLGDFGLARLVSEDQQQKPVSGTPNYFAPELLEGRDNSPQSDMYALGITLFELTFQRLPYDLHGDTLIKKLETHKTATVQFPTPWPASVPMAWQAVLLKLLAKSPEDRYASYDDLINELHSLIPAGTTIAGFAPRSAAFIFDQLLLFLFALPLFIWTALAQQTSLADSWGWTSWPSALGLLLLPFLYIGLISSGRRSLGRILFQLRVVNGYGLPLDRQKMMLREFMRCLPVITLTWGAFATTNSITNTFVIVFVIANIATMLIRRTGLALHDYLVGSSVVLDLSPSKNQQTSNLTSYIRSL
jgi:serine/threonine protein kinase